MSVILQINSFTWSTIKLLLTLCSLIALGTGHAADRWTADKANEWYAKEPWPCGFNYIPANAISYTEMRMPYSFDPKVIDKELALAEDIGFNCLRVVLPFVVWEHDSEEFKKRATPSSKSATSGNAR